MCLWQINLVSLFFNVVGAQQMHFIALRMTTVHTSSVWLPFYGQPLLHSLFIAQLSSTKLMLRILDSFSTCMYGVCMCSPLWHFPAFLRNHVSKLLAVTFKPVKMNSLKILHF